MHAYKLDRNNHTNFLIVLILRQNCIFTCVEVNHALFNTTILLYFRMCRAEDAYWVRCERTGAPPHCIEQEDEASSLLKGRHDVTTSMTC